MTHASRMFVPRPRGRSYAKLNGWLLDACIRDAKLRVHPTIPEKTVWRGVRDHAIGFARSGQSPGRARGRAPRRWPGGSTAYDERGLVRRPRPGRCASRALSG